MCHADEVLAGAVEAQLPQVNVAGAVVAAELRYLAVPFDGGVLAVGKYAFALVVGEGRFREIRYLTGGEIDAHDPG